MTLVETSRPSSLPTLFDPYEEISRQARPSWNKALIAGYAVILIFFGGFGGFAAFAPLHSAVLAPGELRVDNERKVVQHADGGVITEIFVREGQRVKEGEVLARVDSTRVNAQANALRKRYLSALAERARLVAERDGLQEIQLPQEVRKAESDPEIAEIIEGERRLFETRRESQRGQTALFLGQIDQAKTQIEGVTREREAIEEQLGLIEQELNSVRELYEKGLERLPRLLLLKRNQAALKGQLARADGNLAQLGKQIGETELRIVQMQRDFQLEVAHRLGLVVDQIQSMSEDLPVVSASVRRVDLRAPRSGRVIDLSVHTVGQVIQSGQPILQIVPEDEDLVVIARIKPRDIDALNEGITHVQVRLTAFSQRFMHPVEAELESVSDDVVQEANGSAPYYRAILRLDPESRQRILQDNKLTSGMPAMAMIGVGEKTLLRYLLDPILRSIEESLREP
ncbi:MAG: HlyD family type I secretion periplasmic adaptor subunit [Thalassobaculum sp.]|uniref:HlyD family type I secretion periplasmic adaptor subunit n=1 Tax=Thalassobaculum sp. TaxID=2022740 RepID=UPI0032ECFFBA